MACGDKLSARLSLVRSGRRTRSHTPGHSYFSASLEMTIGGKAQNLPLSFRTGGRNLTVTAHCKKGYVKPEIARLQVLRRDYHQENTPVRFLALLRNDDLQFLTRLPMVIRSRPYRTSTCFGDQPAMPSWSNGNINQIPQ
jgi:hypothetical protein